MTNLIPDRAKLAGVVMAAAMASILSLAPLAAAKSAPEPPPLTPKREHPCGDLIVPSHPWREFVDGREAAYGEHWRVERWDDKGQNQGSCDFAVDKASDLIISGYSGYGPPLAWGTCVITKTDTEGVDIEPFYFLDCAAVQHAKVKGKRKTIVWYFEAVANSDPAFVTTIPPDGG